MDALTSAVRRELLIRETVRTLDLSNVIDLAPIDLTPKWKHGWIPLNTEAEAILNAHAGAGHTTHSHAEMHSMPLVSLKSHYSDTIKAHGFQHPYTKKVGKAVGSHPESLAKTATTKAANAGKVKAVVQKAEPPTPDQQLQKALAGATPIEKVQTVHPGKQIVPLQSKTGEHIGYVAVGGSVEPGKTHVVYDLQPKYKGDVNSFTGAQHALGAEVGKPSVVVAPEPPEPPKPPKPEPPTKPVKIGPDPAPPQHPGPGAAGWKVGSVDQLDAAPTGTVVSNALGNLLFTKNADGTWRRQFGANTSGYAVGAHQITNVFWGENGKNTNPPSGYDGPKYSVKEHYSGWQVVDNYNGMTVKVTKGKPNAAKKANDLNIEAGTLSAAQKKKLAVEETKQSVDVADLHVGAAKPEDLNHPQIGQGAPDSTQFEHTFDGSKAGQLVAEGSPGPPTPWETLGSGSSAQDNKRQTANRISTRMATHHGMDDQAKLDASYAKMVELNLLYSGGGGQDGPPHAFEMAGSPYNSSALTKANAESSSPDNVAVRGTSDYRRIMREKIVGNMIQTWAASSNDDHAISLTLQDTAGEMFGVEDQAPWAKATPGTKLKIEALKQDAAFMALARAFLQSQYDDTQATLQAKGITHLTVRRGMKAGVSSSIAVGASGVLRMRPMSSWSTNPDTAAGFGTTVLQTTVPREKVLGFAGSGFGCSGEREVVLIGGRTHARLVRKGYALAPDYHND